MADAVLATLMPMASVWTDQLLQALIIPEAAFQPQALSNMKHFRFAGAAVG